MTGRFGSLTIALTPILLLGGLILLSYQAFYSDRKERIATQMAAFTTEEASLLARRAALANQERPVQFPVGLFWQSAARADAETELHRTVSGLAQRSGLAIRRIGGTPDRLEGGFTRILVEIEAEGTLAAATEFLRGIEAAVPELAVSSLRIRRHAFRSEQTGETLVSLRALVWGYWEARNP